MHYLVHFTGNFPATLLHLLGTQFLIKNSPDFLLHFSRFSVEELHYHANFLANSTNWLKLATTAC